MTEERRMKDPQAYSPKLKPQLCKNSEMIMNSITYASNTCSTFDTFIQRNNKTVKIHNDKVA